MLNERKLIMLVDDDSVCNSINTIYLQRRIAKECDLISFQSPLEALNYLSQCFENYLYCKILILLDINMPAMTGFDFIDEYKKMPVNSTEVIIDILTSSINPVDIEKVKSNSAITDFILKPITNGRADCLLEEMANSVN